MGLGVGIAQLLHRLGGRADADLVEDQVRRRVVGIDDHQVDGVAEREGRPVGEVGRQDARAGHLVRLLERDRLVEVDLLLGRLAVRLDHDRELDQAGRDHRLVGVVGERLARLQVLDGHRDLPLVGLDQRREPRLQGLPGRGTKGRPSPSADQRDQPRHNRAVFIVMEAIRRDLVIRFPFWTISRTAPRSLGTDRSIVASRTALRQTVSSNAMDEPDGPDPGQHFALPPGARRTARRPVPVRRAARRRGRPEGGDGRRNPSRTGRAPGPWPRRLRSQRPSPAPS